MSQQTMEAKKKPMPLNGVDTPQLFATINAVGAHPELAQFQFRASNRWIAGTHSIGRIESFFGAGGEQRHERVFKYDADHPAVLVGKDQGPTPVEFLLTGLLACLTAGIGNIAAARGVKLTKVESRIEGDIDLRGIPGPLERGPQRLPEAPRELRHRGRRAARRSSFRSSSSRRRARRSTTCSRTGVPVEISVDAR